MIRFVEAIFRVPVQLFFLLVLPLLIGLGLSLMQPRSYQTTATIWALRRYEVLGNAVSESDLQANPADTQVFAIVELLQSRAFALDVGHSTQLASVLNVGSDPRRVDDAIYLELSRNVQINAVGYNLLSISYTSRSPLVAQQVVATILENYGKQSQSFSTAGAQQLLDSYQIEYQKASLERDKALQTEAQYRNLHPELKKTTTSTDPEYNFLQSQTKQAQAIVNDIKSKMDTLNQEISATGTGSQTLFKVVDQPQVARQPIPRIRQITLGGGIGFSVGLLACALYLFILIRRDRSIYTTRDLHTMTHLPVVMKLANLELKNVSSLLE